MKIISFGLVTVKQCFLTDYFVVEIMMIIFL